MKISTPQAFVIFTRLFTAVIAILSCAILEMPLSVKVMADEPQVIDVWPSNPPNESLPIDAEKVVLRDKNVPPEKNVQIMSNVSKPTLTIYRPAKDKDTGASVIICPGGGYNILAWDLEGTEVAQWLNDNGITGIILKYRVPTRKDPSAESKSHIQPLQDAQRAMSLIRSKATELKIRPDQIGILGFSAGGNLTAKACTMYNKRAYDAIDDADKVSCRPDFGVLLYPWMLVKDGTSELNPEFVVDAKTPPMFFAHANDDKISAANSVAMYLALKRAGVIAELHVYSTGGHGFGLRPTTKPVSTWPERCAQWMKTSILKK